MLYTYSQFEKSVQRALLERIHRAGMDDKFGQILVPVEEVVELKSGQKNISERKFFPGYVQTPEHIDGIPFPEVDLSGQQAARC